MAGGAERSNRDVRIQASVEQRRQPLDGGSRRTRCTLYSLSDLRRVLPLDNDWPCGGGYRRADAIVSSKHVYRNRASSARDRTDCDRPTHPEELDDFLLACR